MSTRKNLDRIVGEITEGDDAIKGTRFNDEIDAGEGNDTIEAGLGNDVVTGGDGIDTLVFTGNVGAVVRLDTYEAQKTGYGFDTISEIENLTGTSRADRFWGNEDSNVLDGVAGNDRLFGLEGDDTLIGGLGSDRLEGNEDYDLLDDGSGNDTALGGEGDDTVIAGTGNDRLDGGDDIDTLIFQGPRNATVDLSRKGGQNTGYGTDTILNFENVIGGSGNDRIKGDAETNELYGGAGNDTLNGGDGDDIIVGGEGRDVLKGGEGFDLFMFTSASDSGVTPEGRDVIQDFEVGNDLLDFSGFGLDPTTEEHDWFLELLVSEDAPEFTMAGQLHFNTQTSVLSLNLDEDAEVEFEILLVGVTELSWEADFII